MFGGGGAEEFLKKLTDFAFYPNGLLMSVTLTQMEKLSHSLNKDVYMGPYILPATMGICPSKLMKHVFHTQLYLLNSSLQ